MSSPLTRGTVTTVATVFLTSVAHAGCSGWTNTGFTPMADARFDMAISCVRPGNVQNDFNVRQNFRAVPGTAFDRPQVERRPESGQLRVNGTPSSYGMTFVTKRTGTYTALVKLCATATGSSQKHCSEMNYTITFAGS